jgi:predicted HAD superfamily hydrolase
VTEKRIAIEIEVEKRALFANGDFAMLLRRHRQAGVRVVAITDTGLSGEKVGELIDHFHGPGLVDEIYSSADLKASKRQGDLFSLVLKTEGVDASRTLHIGDDLLADCLVPKGMGIQTIHMPKNRLKRLVSKGNGALAEGCDKPEVDRPPAGPYRRSAIRFTSESMYSVRSSQNSVSFYGYMGSR